MIYKTPSKATFDIDGESFGFSAYNLFEEKFGEEFDRYSKHCIESGSNENGWSTE
ncbi:hypothetical protein [Flavobacterium sp. ACN6]|uniref:hypothetical protein n=1 Tax=Flavobacterium sp. ACN6 TaxID=1920426 RepID=UPI001552CA50|nr:hypothetical protein [Flavobacterium sp. ACN6]PBJ12773.1 hypothetical protein BSF42_19540 [Flavobacterium sp. ACN6]